MGHEVSSQEVAHLARAITRNPRLSPTQKFQLLDSIAHQKPGKEGRQAIEEEEFHLARQNEQEFPIKGRHQPHIRRAENSP